MNRTTFAQHTEDLGVLARLIDTLDKKKEILKSHEEFQKMLKLSDELITQKNEALKLIEAQATQADELKKRELSLSSRERSLEQKEADHENAVKVLREQNETLKANQIKNESVSKQNGDLREQLDREISEARRVKAEYEDKKAKLDEVEASLNVRAEKILLREKASAL